MQFFVNKLINCTFFSVLYDPVIMLHTCLLQSACRPSHELQTDDSLLRIESHQRRKVLEVHSDYPLGIDRICKQLVVNYCIY